MGLFDGLFRKKKQYSKRDRRWMRNQDRQAMKWYRKRQGNVGSNFKKF